MKNDLTCGVVRDLLPSYVEGLTSLETNGAVEAHLASCPDCAARRDAMKSPAGPADTAEQGREVDYLKTVKRKSGRRVVLAVVCTAALLLAGLALKLFYIGTQAQEQGLVVLSSQVDGDNTLRLHISTPWSGTAYHSWTAEQTGSRVYIWARQVTASPLCRDGSADLGIPLGGVGEIYLCGRLIWQDGMDIQPITLSLYEAKTPYVGDAPALGRITALLEIQETLGGYTTSLHTSSEPYGWTLEFQEKGQETFKSEQMGCFAPQMLALVENLGEVSWTLTDHYGNFVCHTVTLEAIDSLLPTLTEMYNKTHGTTWEALPSVKDYTDSPASLQRLRALCQLLSSNYEVLWPDLLSE